jgi:hypothetical protein
MDGGIAEDVVAEGLHGRGGGVGAGEAGRLLVSAGRSIESDK